MRGKAARFIPALLWYGVIFLFSSQTGTSSTETSDSVLKILGYDVESITVALADMLSFLVRKGAHISVFFVLTGLLYYGVTGLTQKRRTRLTGTLALCFLFACSDEFHQRFVPGRSGTLRDVLIDTTGGVCFLLALWIVQRIRTDTRLQKETGGG